MPHISLRVSENEKNWMEHYAALRGMKLSDALKTLFFEKMEDEYDLRTIREYEAEKRNAEFFTLQDVKRDLGIDDAL